MDPILKGRNRVKEGAEGSQPRISVENKLNLTEEEKTELVSLTKTTHIISLEQVEEAIGGKLLEIRKKQVFWKKVIPKIWEKRIF